MPKYSILRDADSTVRESFADQLGEYSESSVTKYQQHQEMNYVHQNEENVKYTPVEHEQHSPLASHQQILNQEGEKLKPSQCCTLRPHSTPATLLWLEENYEIAETGQERFRSITQSYFRKADGIILMYDVSKEHSFTSVRHWITSVEEMTGRELPMLMIANKIDLRSKEDKEKFISKSDGKKLANQYGIDLIEVSVKSGEKILDAFTLIIKKMMESEQIDRKDAITLTKEDKKSFLCCK